MCVIAAAFDSSIHAVAAVVIAGLIVVFDTLNLVASGITTITIASILFGATATITSKYAFARSIGLEAA